MIWPRVPLQSLDGAVRVDQARGGSKGGEVGLHQRASSSCKYIGLSSDV
jgi:hypothetical protein